MGRDPLRALEAIYTFDNDDQAWLTGIIDALEPYSWSEGLAAYTSLMAKRISIRAVENRTRHSSAVVFAMARFLPRGFYRRTHAPMPLLFSFDIWPELSAEYGMPNFTEVKFRNFKTPAAWAVCGGDVDDRTTLVVFHCKKDDAPNPRDRNALDQIGAHLGAALRLRRFVAPEPMSGDAAVGAIFTPDGKLLHATGNEHEEAVRVPLIDAIRRSEKSKLRRANAEERLEAWTALVEGRWSVLETVERDGKRFLLAYQNPAVSQPLRALTEREHAVAQYVALGHSLKYIAYELGVAIATVALDLETAIRKLGLSSRAELIQLFARRLRA